MDPQSKLLVVVDVGTSTLAMAQRVVHQVTQGLAPGCLPLFLIDGFKAYRMAIWAHCGDWIHSERRQEKGPMPKPRWMPLPALLSAQVIKSYRRRRLVGVKAKDTSSPPLRDSRGHHGAAGLGSAHGAVARTGRRVYHAREGGHAMTRLTRGHQCWRRTAPLQHGGPTGKQIPQDAALTGAVGRLDALNTGESAGHASDHRPTTGGLPREYPGASPSAAADATP